MALYMLPVDYSGFAFFGGNLTVYTQGLKVFIYTFWPSKCMSKN